MSPGKTSATFCHLMWDRAYIDEYGDVYFCCLCRPKPIGNIYKHDLAHIWQNSDQARQLREMSLSGGLNCYSTCIVLSRKEKETNLGRFYRSRGDLLMAEAAFNDALGRCPRSYNIHFELGLLYKEQKKYRQAEELLMKAIKLDPENFSAYVELGWLYRENNKPKEAEVLFKKAVALEPNAQNACIGLGWLYRENNKPKEAEVFFKKAIAVEPNAGHACLGLGWLYRDQDKTKEAEVFFKKVLALEPNAQSACIGLGWLYKNQGKIRQAEPLLKKARDDETAAGSKIGSRRAADAMDYPRSLQIMPATFCPINCIMCNVDHHLNVVLDNDIIKKNVDFSRIDDIMLHGGEVLAVKSAKELVVWLTDEKHKKIKLITNGLFISREWAERLIKNCEWIEVSVNAVTKKTHETVNRGSNFAKVIRNLKKLIALKRSYGLKTQIKYHFTIVPENIHEAARAINFAGGLGCDIITYGFDYYRVGAFLFKHKRLKEKIKSEFHKAISTNPGIKIQRIQLEHLGLVDSINHKLFDEY